MLAELGRTWGDNIRRGRLALGLTQAQLGDLVGVQQNTIARWENGRIPSDMHKVAIATALHQDVRQLFPLTRPVSA